MELQGKKLGILISAPPENPNFRHGLLLAARAMERQVSVYLYCIDDAVRGLDDPLLRQLRENGINLHACAFAADRHRIPRTGQALFSGLSIVHDLCSATDRFVSFNA